MLRMVSKRASDTCSGSLKRSDAPEACRNRLYGTMVVPMRPTAVRMPFDPSSGSAGTNRPCAMAPQSGLDANAVTRNTTPMNTTMPVRMTSTTLYEPIHMAANASSPSTTTMGIIGMSGVTAWMPRMPPVMLPVSYAMLPTKMAMITITIAIHISVLLGIRSRMFSPRPLPETIPTRDAISWKMMVATVANSSAHSMV